MNRSWKSLKQSRLSVEALARVRARTQAELEQLTLKALRQELALTQAEVGRTAQMTQSELSRVESRNDHLTSTLRRYVEALGGELEIAAVFGPRHDLRRGCRSCASARGRRKASPLFVLLGPACGFVGLWLLRCNDLVARI